MRVFYKKTAVCEGECWYLLICNMNFYKINVYNKCLYRGLKAVLLSECLRIQLFSKWCRSSVMWHPSTKKGKTRMMINRTKCLCLFFGGREKQIRHILIDHGVAAHWFPVFYLYSSTFSFIHSIVMFNPVIVEYKHTSL